MRNAVIRTSLGFPLLISLVGVALGAPTVLTLDKSGDDVVLVWSGGGTTYRAASATGGDFTNVTTLFSGNGSTSFTYTGAQNNLKDVEFFDVTDETEVNKGEAWNGGSLPPLPPMIDPGDPTTNIGSLYIGSLGIIGGSGFSDIPEVNTVCFEGGACTQAISATTDQIAFKTPPGAYSGNVTVTVGDQTSSPASALVMLEDPALGWSSISSIGFSRQNKSYWMAGDPLGGGTIDRSLFRVYFDTGSETWLREDRGGTFSGEALLCSTQTSRTGLIFCSAPAVSTHAPARTRFAQTHNPPSDLANCIDLSEGDADAANVGGVAVDPNPGAVVGRDVVYFALEKTFVKKKGFKGPPDDADLIKKVAVDCSGIDDEDYGNMTDWDWGGTPAMAVDPVTGDLYVADETEIYRVTPSESVQLVKGGFTFIFAIDVVRESADAPGVLVVADFASVTALPLDNPSTTPITVASTFPEAVSFGATVAGGPGFPFLVNTTTLVHSDGNSTVIRPHPLIDVTLKGPFETRISSPVESEALPVGQSKIRPSTVGAPDLSRAVTKLQYRDGRSRFTCAFVVDPGPGAPQYDPEPDPKNLPNCHSPDVSSSNKCDNVDDFVAGGAGSLVGQSCQDCGGNSPCSWEFRITSRYAGDNYKVLFSNSATTDGKFFATKSDIYTAWKHLHIERERMCTKGGLLFQDYGSTAVPGQCGGAEQPACCGTQGQPGCNEILLFANSANVAVNDVLVVFDKQHPFEEMLERTVVAPAPLNNGDGSLTVTFGGMPLPHNVLASNPDGTGQAPLFSNEHSGGVCVPANGFAEADTSRVSDAFSDALMSYHVGAYGVGGSGTVPFYSPIDLVGQCAAIRFSNIWFQNYQVGGDEFICSEGPNYFSALANNYIHVIGASRGTSGDLGLTAVEINTSHVYVGDIIDCCNGINCDPPTGGCDGDKQANMLREVVHHELAHPTDVNACVGFPYHDPRQAWCGGNGGTGSCLHPLHLSQECIMTDGIPGTKGTDLLVDGVDRFCADDLATGDPTCVNMPLKGAMRATEDPQ